MTGAALLTLLLAVSPPMAASDQAEPSTKELAASVTVFSPKGSVTTFDVKGSVTVLKAEAKVGDQTVVTIGSDVCSSTSAVTPSPPRPRATSRRWPVGSALAPERWRSLATPTRSGTTPPT